LYFIHNSLELIKENQYIPKKKIRGRQARYLWLETDLNFGSFSGRNSKFWKKF